MTFERISTISSLVALIIAIMIHEVSHGLVALWCGDDTAKKAKRLSLNPIRHVDMMGTILLPLILALTKSSIMFGWAKPVPINLSNTRNPRQAFWMTSIAGPASNLLQSLIGIGMLHLLCRIPPDCITHITSDAVKLLTIKAVSISQLFFLQYALINIVLMTFNLIPIPPLDGSKVVATILPYKIAMQYLKIEQLGFILIFLLIQQGAFSGLIGGVLSGFEVITGIDKLMFWNFGWKV